MATATSCWQTAPESPSVATGQIDLWRFRLDLPQSHVDELIALLNVDEVARAERLRITEKRKQFIVARAFLRRILSRYLKRNPRTLEFEYGEQGKPRLAYAGGLHFNLTHSGHWGVVAVSAAAIGVDIEKIDPTLDCRLLMKRYLSQQELTVFEAAAASRQLRTFYRLWTAKESTLKLTGSGFSAAAQVTALKENSRYFHLDKNCVASVSFSQPVSVLNKFDSA